MEEETKTYYVLTIMAAGVMDESDMVETRK